MEHSRWQSKDASLHGLRLRASEKGTCPDLSRALPFPGTGSTSRQETPPEWALLGQVTAQLRHQPIEPHAQPAARRAGPAPRCTAHWGPPLGAAAGGTRGGSAASRGQGRGGAAEASGRGRALGSRGAFRAGLPALCASLEGKGCCLTAPAGREWSPGAVPRPQRSRVESGVRRRTRG